MNSEVKSIENLRVLAAALSREAGIKLEIGPGGWSWNPATRTIAVDRRDLERRPIEWCAGVVAHEVAHCLISRYFEFASIADRQPWELAILNALEDGRVENWIKRRYPGTRRWLESLRQTDFDAPSSGLNERTAFALACAMEATGSSSKRLSHGLPANVTQALAATADARRRYVATTPPTEPATRERAPDVLANYQRFVMPRLRAGATARPWGALSTTEQATLCSAAEAVDIAEREILPVAAKMLREPKVRRHRGADSAVWLRALTRALRSGNPAAMHAVAQALLTKAPAQVRRDPKLKGLLDLVMAQLMRAVTGLPAMAASSGAADTMGRGSERAEGSPTTSVGRARSSADSTRRAPRRTPADVPEGLRHYAKIQREHSKSIASLCRTVESALLNAKPPARGQLALTGPRLDVAQLMSYEADPRRPARFWRRRPPRVEHDTTFSLLIDCSGSMRGDRIQSALNGAIIVCEMLAELNIPVAINGFQDELIPVHEHDEEWNNHGRARLMSLELEVEARNTGGHNQPMFNDDGPSLDEALQAMMRVPARQYVLIVISDGLPEGRRSDTDDLRQTIRYAKHTYPHIRLIGVGIGAGTDHVENLYPVSIGSVSLDTFADRLGTLVRDQLLEGLGG